MFRLGMISATLGVALMVACSTKVTQDDCDDGYGRAGDGECYELASGFPCANDEVLNADGDCVEATGGSDLDADEGPPPDEGPDVDSDEGPHLTKAATKDLPRRRRRRRTSPRRGR